MQKGFAIGWILVVVVVLITIAGGVYYLNNKPTLESEVINFEECKQAVGSKLLTSYPAVCVTQSGQRFTRPTDQVQIKPPLTASPSAQTISWQTYTNASLNFSFQYPSSYFNYLTESEKIGVLLTHSKEKLKDEVWVDVTVHSAANIKSVDEYIEIMKQQLPSYYDNIDKQSVTIGGLKGYKITSYQPFGAEKTIRDEGIVLKEEKIYEIVMSAYQKDVLQKFNADFDQLLSTFKFTQ